MQNNDHLLAADNFMAGGFKSHCAVPQVFILYEDVISIVGRQSEYRNAGILEDPGNFGNQADERQVKRTFDLHYTPVATADYVF